jgi:hypothetical protein
MKINKPLLDYAYLNESPDQSSESHCYLAVRPEMLGENNQNVPNLIQYQALFFLKLFIQKLIKDFTRMLPEFSSYLLRQIWHEILA